jgi:hypothetical protein
MFGCNRENGHITTSNSAPAAGRRAECRTCLARGGNTYISDVVLRALTSRRGRSVRVSAISPIQIDYEDRSCKTGGVRHG